MWRIGDRKLIKGIVWDGGSDWIVLSKNFSHYLTYSQDHLLSSLREYFRFSLLPVESFFHTILRNSEFCATIVSNNLRSTNWNRKKGCRCQQKHIVDWCGCSPNVFRIKDINRLLATESKPLFFARKFDHQIDSGIIDFVEFKFLEKNFGDTIDYDLYYQNTYHWLHDDAKVLKEFRRRFYEYFAKKFIETFQDRCFTDIGPDVETSILESGFLLNKNQFFGSVIKFNAQTTNAEILLQQKQNDTFLFTENNLQLQILKVCNKFDEKEEKFRNFECLLFQTDSLEIMHQWKLELGLHRIEFVLLDAQNYPFFFDEIVLNQTHRNRSKISQIFLYKIKHVTLNYGLHKLILVKTKRFT
ncbi:xylosyltransferase oxt-like protein [Sarcoptes scabiei]|uniref:protein xylosyltransferase n=1 Tax=Sarcoptes scabiei TaxID=52283 RepID=A0A131ZXK7_SARSC|nr:xylosyltransferase oxt-like protein [Sarcoptes scabiei]